MSPSADAITFRYSLFFTVLYAFAVVLCVGLASAGAAAVVVGHSPGVSTLGAILIVLFFGSAAAYGCGAILRYRCDF